MRLTNKHGGFRERAGKPCPFNDEQKKFIRDNYSTIGPRKIAKNLKVKDYLVFYFGVSEGLRKNDTNRYRKAGLLHNGLFNVNALENWVA